MNDAIDKALPEPKVADPRNPTNDEKAQLRENAQNRKTLAEGAAQLIGMGAVALGGGSAQDVRLGGAVALNADRNNRQLHPTEAKLIKENAAKFARQLNGGQTPTVAQIDAAQERLTSTTLNQVDSAFDKRITTDDPLAQTFLKGLASQYGTTDVGGGKLFDARGTTAFTNHTINAQYLNQTAPLYNQLDSKDLKGVAPNVRGAYVAYSDANNDANLKNLAPQQIVELAKTGSTLRAQAQTPQEANSIASAGLGRTQTTMGQNGVAKPGDGSQLEAVGLSALTDAGLSVVGDGTPASGKLGSTTKANSKLPTTTSEFVPGYKEVNMAGVPAGARGVVDPTSGELLVITNRGTLQQPTMKTGNPVLDAPVLSHADGTIWSTNIKSQGAMGEVVLNRDNRGVGLHNNEPVIDVFDAKTGQAVSIKTLDWNTTAKINNPASVETTIKGQVNDLVNYEGTRKLVGNTAENIPVESIKTKTLELVLPATGGTPAQVAAVNRAIDYAKQRGVTITIVKAK